MARISQQTIADAEAAAGGGTSITDADDNTKIQVEESSDENIPSLYLMKRIRF